MFGYRSDGKKLKNVDPIIRLTSYIMKTRNDAQVNLERDVNCQGIDEFIRNEFEKGNKYSYMHVVVAGLVRMYALRPKLNRFVMSGRIYARDKIYISFAVKKRLDDNSDETTIKLAFTGHENIKEIKAIIDDEIRKASIISEETKTDKLARKLLNLPHFILSPVVGFVKLLDKFGIMPKSVIEASPFHTSCFLTNLKSLGIEHVFHHLYNFGTTGIFVGMGKEKRTAVVNKNGELNIAKIMKLGLVIDERVCDGFYYARSLKIGIKHMENPLLLIERLETLAIDPDLGKTRKEKREQKKIIKKDIRLNKKQQKLKERKDKKDITLEKSA
jgi:hypothetical protein